MTDPTFGRILPVHSGMLALAGYYFSMESFETELAPTDTLKVIAMRSGASSLAKLTGRAFSTDLASWREWLLSQSRDDNHGYAIYPYVDEVIQEQIADPDRARLEALALGPKITDATISKVAILISGSGSNMETLVKSMTGDHPGRPVLVISDKPEAAGLDKAIALGVPIEVHVKHKADPPGWNDDLIERSVKDGMPREEAIKKYGEPDPTEEFEAALDAALQNVNPDVICLAGFMRILSPDFVSKWAGKIINIHPSLLPKHKGLHTHRKVLEAGDTEHGCTVHMVTAALDDGPILGQVRIDVLPGDTAESLAARLLPLEHQLYAQTLRRFAAGEQARFDLTQR